MSLEQLLQSESLGAVRQYFMVFGWTAAAIVLATVLLAGSVRRWCFGTWRGNHVRDFLKFDSIINGDLLKDVDGGFHRVLLVGGQDFAAISEEDRAGKRDERQSWIESLSESAVRVKVISRSEGREKPPPRLHQDGVLGILDRLWERQFSRCFEMSHAIILSVDNKRQIKLLEEVCRRTERHLADYQVRSLGVTQGGQSELLTLLAELLSPGWQGSVPDVREDVRSAVIGSHIEFFRNGVIRFASGQSERFGAVIGVRRWGEATDDEMIADLLDVPADVIVLNMLEVFDDRSGERKILMRKETQYFDEERMGQLEEAVAFVRKGSREPLLLCEMNMSVFVFADDLEDLQKQTSEVIARMTRYGIRAVVEEEEAAAAYFSLFPGNEYKFRHTGCFSRNVACYTAFDGTDTGHENSAFGPGAIMRFRPVVGSGVINFQFHEGAGKNANGHTMIVGKTGGGKTTLMELMVWGALRHEGLRVVCIDRRRAMYAFVRSVGGMYFSFSRENRDLCAANPLHLELTMANRKFIRRWLKLLARQEGDNAGPEIDAMIAEVLRTLEKMGPHMDRSLKAFWPTHFAETPFAAELHKWVFDPDYNWIFNGERDAMSETIRQHRIVAVDSREVIDDEVIAAPYLMYMMHVTETEAVKDGVPFLLTVDEAARATRNKHFVKIVEEVLEEWRKLRGVAVFAFQKLKSMGDAGLAETFRTQTATRIYLRSREWSVEELTEWNLTRRQIDFLRMEAGGGAENKYSCLVRQEGWAATPVFDLAPLNAGGRQWSELFNSSPNAVRYFERMERLHGDGALEAFLDADGIYPTGLEEQEEVQNVDSVAAE